MVGLDADIVIVGGGIAGSAMATVMARRGVRVTVLERQQEYRDRVRGEYMQPWGVAETQRNGLLGVLENAGALYARFGVPYDELRQPQAAEDARRDLGNIVPGVPGGLCIGHPAACAALSEAAQDAGADVLRGVKNVRFTLGSQPEVSFELDGAQRRSRCALVVGADGRQSGVRQQAGIPLEQAAATHLVCGLLVEPVPEWPSDSQGIGTERDVMFFVFPQAHDRLRLYFCMGLNQRDRFAGADGPRRFLETFRRLTSLPLTESIGSATPIGPCATYSGEDTWTDVPFRDGVVLIGDAAGYNDPIIGEGLSLAMRDVRVLSDILLQEGDWSPAQLQPYADERRERMRRMRFTASLMAALYSEFGPEARERRGRFQARLRDRSDPKLKFALAASSVGPDKVPAFAFEESMREKVLQ